MIPCAPEVARAAVRGGARAVARRLGVEVDPSWPPADLLEVLPGHADAAEMDPAWASWGIWLVLDESGSRLVGDAGFKGPPGADGEVEIGYGIIASFRRRGLATEMVRALVQWAFHHGARKVQARCYTDNLASQGVLRNVGFRWLATEEDVQEWEMR